MDVILDKCIFQISSLISVTYVVGTHWNCLIEEKFQCTPTSYVHSMNECFSPYTGFHKFLNYFFMFQCNEHVEMNKFCVFWRAPR